MPIQIDIVPLATGFLLAMGGGAGLAKLIDGLLKIRSGMSARENQRKVDIVQQRDLAIAREEKAWRLVDSEAEKRRREQEYSARLRRQLIENGIEPEASPVFEKTITKAQLKELRNQDQE